MSQSWVAKTLSSQGLKYNIMSKSIAELQDLLEDYMLRITHLEKKVRKLQVQDRPTIVWLTSPLTSTSWDGDAYSTTAKTVIDLSSVFSVPANVKAVMVRLFIRDSGSAAAANNWMILSPNATADEGMGVLIAGVANDEWRENSFWVTCDSNGDIYYQITASVASAMDVYLQIWAYIV